MRLTLENQRKQYRIIYESILEMPRVQVKDITAIIGGSRNTVSKRIREALDLGYIVGPHLRKKAFKNFKEYTYFLGCTDPIALFEKYTEDENVFYHAILDGPINFWMISTEEIDIDEDVVVEGVRSNYHLSVPPDQSWDHSIKMMQEKVRKFDPDEYASQKIINNHWGETIEWDSEDELLFKYFKYNLRKPLSPMIEKHDISAGKAWNWLRRLPETCTIATSYFPEKISAYDPFLFTFKTDYEDFIVDLFSELPTSCLFFKVSNRLLLRAHVNRGSMSVDFNMPDITKLHIPLLMRDLLKKGIIKEIVQARFKCYWRENLND